MAINERFARHANVLFTTWTSTGTETSPRSAHVLSLSDTAAIFHDDVWWSIWRLVSLNLSLAWSMIKGSCDVGKLVGPRAEKLEAAKQVLRDYGDISNCTCIYVLDYVRQHGVGVGIAFVSGARHHVVTIKGSLLRNLC